MREITVGNRSERKVLKVNIGEKSYSLPLLGSLTMKEATRLETQEGTLAFITDYIPKDVINELTVEDFNSIVDAWKSASDIEGASLGES
jgi:hypothetical protein